MSQYATTTQANERMAPYFDGLTADEITVHLVDASGELDQIFSAIYELPLTAYPTIVTTWAVNIGAYRASIHKNFNASGEPSQVRQLYEDAIRGAKELVARGGGTGFEDSTPETEESGSFVVTNRKRGWR